MQLVPPVDDELARVEADVVQQFERAHGITFAREKSALKRSLKRKVQALTGTELHADVDVVHGGVSSLEQADGLHHVGHKQAVDDESWGVAALK